MRECVPIIVLALVAIGGLTWAILALRRSLARERRLARVDDVTGVRNARAFHEAAGAEIERARRYQHPFSVAVVDLGSRVGDDLVRSAATVVRGALRATDLVARLGRDEFIALLPETTAASARNVSSHRAPEQLPANPVNRERASAAADSVTPVPSGKLAAQAPGQSIPGGVEVTRPMPAPAGTTATLKTGMVENDAATLAALSRRR